MSHAYRSFTSGTLSIIPLAPEDSEGLDSTHSFNRVLNSLVPAGDAVSTHDLPFGSRLPELAQDLDGTSGQSNVHITSTAPPSRTFSVNQTGDALRFFFPDHHDKPRRVLHSIREGDSSFIVSMYGHIAQMKGLLTNSSAVSATEHNLERDVLEDACILSTGKRDEEVAILAFSRESDQLSVVSLNESRVTRLERPGISTRKGGVSAVTAMMQPLMFASGGLDHVVHLWDFESDSFSASSRPLNIKHHSLIQSLLPIRDTSHKLISAGADCNVHVYDLGSERVSSTLKASNSVYHVHEVSDSSPFCTLLEVAHKELQFEIRDHRLVPEKPVQRFGYTTSKSHGRYIKGASLPGLDLFACGDREGNLRLWDLRNVNRFCGSTVCFDNQKIVQVVFKEYSRLIAASENNNVQIVNYLQT